MADAKPVITIAAKLLMKNIGIEKSSSVIRLFQTMKVVCVYLTKCPMVIDHQKPK
jgi:hypothetical protein